MKFLRIGLLWVLIAPAWAAERNGVSFTMESAWSVSTPQGTIQPVRYRLENRGPAQDIQVILTQPGSLRLTRSHRLESGEQLSGWIYVPLAKGSWNNYGQGHFRASKSGSLPQNQWVGFSTPMDYRLEQTDIPRLVLVGQRFDLTGLQDAVEAWTASKAGSRGGGSSGSQGAFARVGAEAIPSSWLGLAGISAVFLEQSQAELLSPESKTALADYVSVGGVLLLVSADAAWCAKWWGDRGTLLEGESAMAFVYGLGAVRQVSESPTGANAWAGWLTQLKYWESRTGKANGAIMNRNNGERIAGLTVLETLGTQELARPDFPRVSYMALWWLMAAFAVVVGPVNYGILRHRGRLPWFIITAPAISIGFGAILLLAFVAAEGRQAKAVVGGLTFLFQRDHQAVTCQRMSVYATSSLPLQFPSGTLVWDKFGKEFGDDSNVPYGRRQPVTDSGGAIDCTSGWQLGEGFLPPRLLRAFGSLQVRPERGRLLMELRGDQWQVQNGLGVALTGLLYRDASGRLFTAGEVRNGESAHLEAVSEDLDFWLQTIGVNPTTTRGRFTLPPNAYIAVTPEVFGFEKPHPRLTVKPTPHIIYGFL